MKKINIFCDFDGTITQKDLGDEIFKNFGEFYTFNKLLVNGEITIYEYWEKTVGSLVTGAESKIKEYALNAEIDPYFVNFIKTAKDMGCSIFIVSDGFSQYISPITEKFSFNDIPVFSNTIDFNNCPKPIYYGRSEECKCMCASCKRNVVVNISAEDEIIVYIGDGYSDFCAATHSDIIFAKKNLAKYLSENRIPFYNFKTFFDIIKIFNNLQAGKLHFKKRRQAELKRKQVFECE